MRTIMAVAIVLSTSIASAAWIQVGTGTGPAKVSVVSGRLVQRLESGPRQAGIHAVRWDGSDGRGRVVPSGVYFVRFSAGRKVSTGRLTLVR
jgi:flagellar hook assembly protein FlgD